ncbi:MAG: GGDEF domain-containing protein [Actinobacteria bacterium]|nr:GGDEF domain-containing protein [Actinomycetota bacterium]
MANNAPPQLKTDTTLAELRAAAPRDERELAMIVGAVWWIVSPLSLVVGTLLLPPVIDSGINAWRIGGMAFALLIAASHLTWMRKLPPKAGYDALFVMVLIGQACTLTLMLAAPVTVAALTLHLLPAAMFSAYFLSGRRTAVVVAVVTAITVVPLIFNLDESTAQRMTSRLTVWMPIVWLIGLAIHLQGRDRRESVAAAERQAFTDPLTGIDNLRALIRNAEPVLARPLTHARVSALLMIDVDELREINTMFGHATGDEVLRDVAKSLSAVVGPGHTVARISGDTFAVLIEEVSPADIAAMMLRYRSALQSAPIREELPGLRLDAAIGAATRPSDGNTLEELMTAAERSLYAAKQEHASIRDPVAAGSTVADVKTTPRPRAEEEPPDPTAIKPVSEEPFFLGRPLHSLMAVGAWYLAITLVLTSLAMPDADRSHLDAILIYGFALFVPATLNFFFTPPIGTTRHAVNDVITLIAIAVAAYLTGGALSPAWALVFMFLMHDGWFMSGRQLAPRFLGAALVILLPVLYDDLGSGPQRTAIIATLYMGVVLSFEQILAMGFNRTYMLRAEDITRRLAELEPLTGLPSRPAFEQSLRLRLGELRYYDLDALAIVMLDLDGFKRVNAEHGHGAGDRVLCDVAETLRMATRGEDLVARIGADEFAVLMPTNDEHEARALAERLVDAADACLADSPDVAGISITARAGFALYPTHGRSVDQLMAAAELALLTVKAGGRLSRVSKVVVGL